jgi:DNA-binding transcriptional LysR family regulator
MTTVPTDLLRTLVTVVDLRSFTKAAQSLGVTQPAVSAQIKRLQILLGSDLLDKSAPGVALTEKGELVVNYARRLLTINDRILQIAGPRRAEPPLRIGVPSDFAATILPATLVEFRARYPGLRFHVRADISDNLLRDLRQGHLDLAVALTTSGPALDVRHHWREEVAWVRSPALDFAASSPLPLASLGDESVVHRLATEALSQAGRDYDTVFTAFSLAALLAGVAAGIGVTLLPARSVPPELGLQDQGVLPKPADMWCGIYLREGIEREVLAELADTMGDVLRPRPEGVMPTRAPADWSSDAVEESIDPSVVLRAGSRS